MHRCKCSTDAIASCWNHPSGSSRSAGRFYHGENESGRNEHEKNTSHLLRRSSVRRSFNFHLFAARISHLTVQHEKSTTVMPFNSLCGNIKASYLYNCKNGHVCVSWPGEEFKIHPKMRAELSAYFRKAASTSAPVFTKATNSSISAWTLTQPPP